MTEFNPFQLSGKTFLITGAASGIGQATAILLSKLGADLILLDLDKIGLNNTLKNCKTSDLTKVVDLSNSEELIDVVKKTILTKNKIDGFAHIAGIPCILPLKTTSKTIAQKILNVNTLPALDLAKIFSDKRYGNENGGSIVLVSSIYANVGSGANVLYAMSKSALHGITKSLAIELAPKKIRVNCVAPGFVKTEMNKNISSMFDKEHNALLEQLHPLGLGSADDVAYSIAFLLSDAAKWITGTIMNVDGGFCAK